MAENPKNDPATRPGDIVIVGAGLAGLFTALKLSPLPATVVSAAPLGQGASSVWAQGGIAAAVGEGDTTDSHAADTIRAGAGLVDEDVARLVAKEAPERIRDLLEFGVPFDRDLAGRLKLSREAAHSARRVVRVSGDKAGAAIMQALIASVAATPSIRVLEGYEAVGLMQDGTGAIEGLRLRGTDDDAGYELLPARAVVLATGGIGGLYAVTTNPRYARGAGIAMAAAAGASIADAEFVQFHPTALDVGTDPAPLASEALRGEGAVLVNSAGKRFLADKHKDAELGPRDIVAGAVFAEVAAGRGAYLDCRDAIGDRFPEAFPTVYDHCLKAGIDPLKQPIPVAPAQHYHMGGIATSADGRTDVPGLWALGEVASTGLHGANRLASNSLIEAVVFGARVAESLKQNCPADLLARANLVSTNERGSTEIPQRECLESALRETMSRHAGVVRDGDGMKQAIAFIRAIEDLARGADTHLYNMALAARFIVTAALLRTQSRGAHVRSDAVDMGTENTLRAKLTLQDLDNAYDAMIEPAARQDALVKLAAALVEPSHNAHRAVRPLRKIA